MLRSSNPANGQANRIGAYGFTLLMAFGGLNAIGGTSLAATANVAAQRLQAPAAVVVTAPVAAPTPITPITPTNAERVASVVVDLTNQARATAGLAPLAINPQLTNAAIAHSADQATAQTMSHTGTNGSNPGARMTAAGYTWWTWGENVAAGQKTPALVVDAWMNSPGHRANILNGDFTHIGIGSVTSTTGVIYWTMDLAA